MKKEPKKMNSLFLIEILSKFVSFQNNLGSLSSEYILSFQKRIPNLPSTSYLLVFAEGSERYKIKEGCN